MKRILYVFLLCCIILSGCGREDQQQIGNTWDSMEQTRQQSTVPETPRTTVPPEQAGASLMLDRNQIFDIDLCDDSESGNHYVGMQFYKGEPVMLYLKTYLPVQIRLVDGEYRRDPLVLYQDSGLYIQRQDGSQEQLAPGASLLDNLLVDEEEKANSVHYGYSWYVDEEGNCYCYPRLSTIAYNSGEGYFMKINSSGELLYKTSLEAGFEAEDFVCIDGTMYVVISKKEQNITTKKVVAFDRDNGMLSEEDAFVLSLDRTSGYFGEGPDGLYVFLANEIKRIDLEAGNSSDFLSLKGSSYSNLDFKWKFGDFRVLDDGSAEALYYCDEEDGRLDVIAKGIQENLSLLEKDRIVITLRAASISNWLKDQATKYNKSNDIYWVRLEELSTGKAADRADYARLTNVELSTGKGPDIICGDLMESYIRGLLQKGVLLNLKGLMESTGIREEEYLAAAFDSWQSTGKEQEIYGINISISPRGYQMRREVLPDGGTVDIYKLMDALSERDGEATYYDMTGAQGLLKMFLEGSEDLWGMLDWETGSCDFNVPLFTQILENAKRYDAGSAKNQKVLLAFPLNYKSIYHYDSHEEMEGEGTIVAGALFDDGCHGAVDSRYTLAINANSPRKEGAWEFICYLLTEEAQSEITKDVPVKKVALQTWLGLQLTEVSGNNEKIVNVKYMEEGEIISYRKIYTKEDITDERIAEYLGALEDVRVLPFRTGPILEIIYEEAEAYFSGSKSAKDVSKIIQNRVQLYLDEQ